MTIKQLPDYDQLWTDTYGDLQRMGPTHYHASRIVKRLLKGLDYRSVLDVGCGPGWNLRVLKDGRVLDSIVGIDISEAAINQARRQEMEAQFLVHDIQHSPLPGQWDLVYCSLVLHLVPDDVAAIRNLRENTGKYLLISTMAGDFDRYKPWEHHLGHVRNYRRGELEDKLAQAGFRMKRVIYWGFPFFSPLARWVQNVSGVGTGNYSLGTRLIARTLTALYYFNSAKRGDLLIILAEV